MLQQYNFGAGTLFLVRTDITTPTPIRVGTLQDVSVDMSFQVKELYGQYQAPVAVARGQQKITGKAKIANLNARQLNDAFLGQTLATGEQINIVDEGGPNGTPIPSSSPYHIVVANGSSMSSGTPGIDLGVFNAGTGIQMTRVSTGPTTGQYSCDMTTGTYTFAAADEGLNVLISYAYFETTTGNHPIDFDELPHAAWHNHHRCGRYGRTRCLRRAGDGACGREFEAEIRSLGRVIKINRDAGRIKDSKAAIESAGARR